MSNKMKVTYFSPMIGAWQMATDALMKDEPTLQFEYNGIYNFEAFRPNATHWEDSFPTNKITYLSDDLIPDYFDGTDNWKSISTYKKYMSENSIVPSDIMLAIPVCAGLSMLNCGNRGADCAANKWMYETVKWHLAQGNKVLCFENAPGLVGAEGVKVLRTIESILEYNGVRDQYKIHATKTTTLNHNLPQHRQRTFLYIYKSDEFVQFKNIDNPEVLLEDIMIRPEHEVPGTDHITLAVNDPGLSFVNEHNHWDEIRSLVSEKIGIVTITKWLLNKYANDNTIFDNYPKIKKIMDHMNRKLDDGKGYWDAFPIVAKGKVNAIISKNAFRTIHPKYNRFITVREMMDLMGYPEELKISGDIRRNFNHVCQSVPVCTAKDHLRWAQGIVNNDPKYVVKTFVDPKVNVLLQTNMNRDLENDMLYIDESKTSFEKYRFTEKKTKLKAFFG